MPEFIAVGFLILLALGVSSILRARRDRKERERVLREFETREFTLPELWRRGRFFRALGLEDAPNQLEIASAYSRRLREVNGDQTSATALKDILAVLSVPLHRDLYRDARSAMDELIHRVGPARALPQEETIWQALWAEVRTEYARGPGLVTREVRQKLIDKHAALAAKGRGRG